MTSKSLSSHILFIPALFITTIACGFGSGYDDKDVAIAIALTQTASAQETPEMASNLPSLPPQATLEVSALPEATPTDSPMALAVAGVSSNAEWVPYTEEVNGVAMALVPAGCFLMGSDAEQQDEKPSYTMCFKGSFWIDVYEVTNAQFRSLGGVAHLDSARGNENRPRELINWYEASDFCHLRKGRLPTEAEWEYAARGPDSLIFPWGNEFNGANIVYFQNSDGRTAEVGSRLAGVSWIGTYDMIGNVWEWTSTLKWKYPYDANDGREDPNNTIDERVIRGSSWYYGHIEALRASNRYQADPNIVDDDLGFRCVQESPRG